MNIDYSKYFCRKFIISVFALIASTILTFLGKIDANNYFLIVSAILGIYTTGDVAFKKNEKKYDTPSN